MSFGSLTCDRFSHDYLAMNELTGSGSQRDGDFISGTVAAAAYC